MANNVLSIFIDESGDFGSYSSHSPYYLVSMIFHNQSVEIDSNILALEHHLKYLDIDSHNIHTAPLIRREDFYRFYSMEVRKSLFNTLFHFTRKLDIKYLCPFIPKYLYKTNEKSTMIKKVYHEVYSVLNAHYTYISHFDSIVVYYDNGQTELTKILTSVFCSLFINVEFRRIQPEDYRLSQVADLICTLELLAHKYTNNCFSQSEMAFFDSPRNFYRNYYRQIVAKKL